MERLRFEFMLKASDDGKSNVLCLISLGTPDGRSFAIPEDLQPTNLHKELITSEIYRRVKTTLKKRNQFRKVWITLTENLAKDYLDEENNLLFDNYYLEDITEEETDKNISSTSGETIKKLLEKVLENKQQKSEIQNLSKIAKDFMIDKFDEKNSNATQWINDFEKECERCLIEEDRKKIEILKFFLEKSSVDWYSCMIFKFTVESEWIKWKENFCETYGNKGWSSIRYAFEFKYHTGSLLEYALKKEKLLLQARKSIDKETLIDLIAVGLPNYVSDRIDREKLKETQDLYNEIGKFEYLMVKKKFVQKKKNDKQISCKTCEKLGKGIRYHPDAVCWFKSKELEQEKKSYIKHVNNARIEAELKESDEKNEQ